METIAGQGHLGSLAAEAGLPFTYEETKELAKKSNELSLDDLDAAAGGSESELGRGVCVEILINPYAGDRPAGMADARPAGI